MPLLLRYVLRRARSRDDIVPVCMELRESRQAERFRKFVNEFSLRYVQADHAKMQREIGDYAKAISKAVGASERPEAAFAILETAADIASAATGPNIAHILKAGMSSERLLEKMVERWRARRFALITTPMRLHSSLADVRQDLQRLFGSHLTDDELFLVAKGRRLHLAPQSGCRPVASPGFSRESAAERCAWMRKCS